MSTSRRSFLGLASATLAAQALSACTADKDGGDTASDDTAGTPTPERAPEPAPWLGLVDVDPVAFPCGVQTGDATTGSVLVTTVTTEAVVGLRVVRAEGDAWVDDQEVEDLAPDDAGRVRLEVGALRADTAYALCFLSADGTRQSRIARVRTPPAAGAAPRVIRFGATSCLAGNQPWPSLTHASTQGLDVFLFLGDTVYADDAQDLDGYRRFWTNALGTAGLQDVTASTSTLATWDDHEVANNWPRDGATEEKIAAGLQAFQEGFPARAGGGRMGIWRTVSWGDAIDFFVLDSRGERLEGRYLSPEQTAWLKEGLVASRARFKVILNSVPITDLSNFFGTAEASDRWQGFPEERADLLAHIVENDVRGVLFVAGDLHYGQIGQVDPAGGLAEGLTEVLVGPGGSQVNILAAVYPGNPQYAALVPAWNWTSFDCDPVAGTIRVRHFGDDGVALTDWVVQA